MRSPFILGDIVGNPNTTVAEFFADLKNEVPLFTQSKDGREQLEKKI